MSDKGFLGCLVDRGEIAGAAIDGVVSAPVSVAKTGAKEGVTKLVEIASQPKAITLQGTQVAIEAQEKDSSLS